MVNGRSVNPSRSRWIGIFAGTLTIAAWILLTIGNEAKGPEPQLRLRELFASEGKQWAYFAVYAPSNSAVMVQYERLLGTHGRQISDSFQESNTRQPIMLLPGGSQEVHVKAPVSGVWRARFSFQAPRKGVLLWIDRLKYAWRHRTLDIGSTIPWYQEWVLESGPVTNTVPEPP